MTTDNERYVDYLDFTGLSWKRPDGPIRLWRVVDGRKKTADGKIPRFSIQEVPKELENDVIDFMATYLLEEETVNAAQGTSREPLAVREFRTLWRDALRQGVSVVALTVNSDPTTKPVIAGANILSILTSQDEDTVGQLMQFRSIALKKSMRVQLQLMQESNVMERYGIDKHMTATGLCVLPSFRGQGLGEEILRTRDDIALAYQIPASETIYTGMVSQILAARVGHEVLFEKKYSELLDEEGKVAFPRVTVEFIKVMGKRFY